jgi:hypothetical protein
VQSHPRLHPELQVIDAEICDFLHPAAGVVQHQQERAVPEGEAALGRQLTEERGDRVPIEKARFGWRNAFAGNRRDLLRDGETLGHTPSQKLKEGVQGHQPVIPRPPVIVSSVF